ncbi:hypothetical protein CVS40_1822 [Lucilia cuprina]|nr:hypothetical protein CVS40_1822 [Lucilia cuprina]
MSEVVDESALQIQDRNHYCKNCGCYFGEAMRISSLKKVKCVSSDRLHETDDA